MSAAVAPAALPLAGGRRWAPRAVASAPAPRLGVVTSSLAEGRMWRRAAAASTFASGADGARARRGAERLAHEGALALISFGLAAGLAPVARPGDLIVAESVVAPSGATFGTDHVWRAALLERLSRMPVRVIAARLAGHDVRLTSPTQKRAAFRGTFAAALDTESHAVAEVAAAHGLPFIAVRAIADAVEDGCPQSVIVGIGAAGERRRLAVLACLARRPLDVAAAWRLAGQARAARAVLAQVAALMPMPATAVA